MNLIYYTLLFLAALLIFIFFNQTSLIDSVILALFLVSSFLFIFSKDPLPSASTLQFPEAYKYYKKRINTYGYIMAASYIIAALIFTISFGIQGLRQGVISLLLWPILITISYLTAQFYSKNEVHYLFSQYLRENLSEKNQDYGEIAKKVLTLAQSNNLENEALIRRICIPIQYAVLRESIYWYRKFAIRDEKISSSEVSAANEKFREK